MKYFNPRTHRGVRPCFFSCPQQRYIFQSTHPSWGATRGSKKRDMIPKISIHAPIVGCDHQGCFTCPTGQIFQSTHPSWGATSVVIFYQNCLLFQSTHPSWGATQQYGSRYTYYTEFQSTHPSWGATGGMLYVRLRE